MMGMQVRCNYVVGVYENPTSTSHDKTFAPEESCSLYDSADKPTKNRCILCKNYGRNLIINLHFTHAIFNHFWSLPNISPCDTANMDWSLLKKYNSLACGKHPGSITNRTEQKHPQWKHCCGLCMVKASVIILRRHVRSCAWKKEILFDGHNTRMFTRYRMHLSELINLLPNWCVILTTERLWKSWRKKLCEFK